MSIRGEELQDTIDRWYSSWHRFAAEDEDPPDHMLKKIAEAERLLGMRFDVMRGTWSNNP